MGEVFSVMVKLRTIPVATIPDEFVEESLVRLDSLVEDVGNCLRQYMVWESEYEEKMETDLEQKVEGKISKMETDQGHGHWPWLSRREPSSPVAFLLLQWRPGPSHSPSARAEEREFKSKVECNSC